MVIEQEEVIAELTNMVEWEPVAHQQFTDKLIREGLDTEDIRRKNLEEEYIKNTFGADKYYQGVMMLSDIEKEALDIT